jgi:hypothetical protein
MLNTGGTWLEALRGIKDNPVYLYLRLAQRRRLQRVSWFRRNWLVALIIALELVSAWYFLIQSYISGTDWKWRDLLQPALLEQLSYIMLLPVYCVWFCQGLFQAVLDALLVLAPAGRRLRLLVLDDLCAVTSLTDRELAAGVLANLLPPLFWRIAAGAGLITASAISSAYDDSTTTVERIYPVLTANISASHINFTTLVPAVYTGVFITSALGTLALLLLMLALSRSMRPVLATCGAVLMVIMQVQYIMTAMALTPGMGYGMEFPSEISNYITLILVGIPVLFLGLLRLAAYLSRISKSFRYVFATGAPVIAAVVPFAILMGLPLTIPALNPGTNSPDLALAFSQSGSLSYMYSVGALSAINPLGVPYFYNQVSSVVPSTPAPLQSMLLLPLLMLLQLALIRVFAREALIAIRLRRQGVE